MSVEQVYWRSSHDSSQKTIHGALLASGFGPLPSERFRPQIDRVHNCRVLANKILCGASLLQVFPFGAASRNPLSHKIKKQPPKWSHGLLNCLWEVKKRMCNFWYYSPEKEHIPQEKRFQNLTNFLSLAHFDSPTGMMGRFVLAVNISGFHAGVYAGRNFQETEGHWRGTLAARWFHLESKEWYRMGTLAEARRTVLGMPSLWRCGGKSLLRCWSGGFLVVGCGLGGWKWCVFLFESGFWVKGCWGEEKEAWGDVSNIKLFGGKLQWRQLPFSHFEKVTVVELCGSLKWNQSLGG